MIHRRFISDIAAAVCMLVTCMLFTTAGTADCYEEIDPYYEGFNVPSMIHIANTGDVTTVRNNVRNYLWKAAGWPETKMPVSSVRQAAGWPSWAVDIGSSNFDYADRLDIEMDYQIHSYSYLLHPRMSVNRLLIFHQGHSSNLLDCGGQQTMKYFLDRGFTIMTFWMPLFAENSLAAYNVPSYGTITFGANAHDEMSQKLENSDGSFIRFFVEPVVVGINYVKANYNFGDIMMTGISGGGWTTHIASAIDPRIELSFPTAGSLPLYLRSGPCSNGSQGDAEQYWAAMYGTTDSGGGAASWPDIYILAGYGHRREQVHILNKYDSCCFGGINYQTYEPYAAEAVEALGMGSYRVYLDMSHSSHKISDSAIENAMWPRVAGHLPTSCADVILGGYRLQGDVNSDCKVDVADIAKLAEEWLRCTMPTDAACEKPWL